MTLSILFNSVYLFISNYAKPFLRWPKTLPPLPASRQCRDSGKPLRSPAAKRQHYALLAGWPAATVLLASPRCLRQATPPARSHKRHRHGCRASEHAATLRLASAAHRGAANPRNSRTARLKRSALRTLTGRRPRSAAAAAA
ncbi:hypothetical protein NPIL_611951 [Nephila pilipes]|uniref:Uncharacterized protein n=1 Tax=Nephila pilipes TaxID=299642 RepID=A0A8X6T1Z9_NEPPI|nr:hypothetical protein NPIL_611951 [Nephila pilipes]